MTSKVAVSLRVPLLMTMDVMVGSIGEAQMNVDLEVASLRWDRDTDAYKSDAGHKGKAGDKSFSTHVAPPSLQYLLDARAW